ncbi:hypothetical protein H311_00403 [Anncaliia algerae PRA109]|nr:hypothetical protein H311_00403 [Anncaliia algerae PRA109]
MMENDFLKRENICALCNNPHSLVRHKNSIDGLSWRSMNVKCKNYKKYVPIRKNSFFHGFNLELKNILRVVIKYSYFQQSYSIKNSDQQNNFLPREISRIIFPLKNK